jgi:hypothetical protein
VLCEELRRHPDARPNTLPWNARALLVQFVIQSSGAKSKSILLGAGQPTGGAGRDNGAGASRPGEN